MALPGESLETWARVASRSGNRMTIPAGALLQRAGHRVRKLLYIRSGEVRMASVRGDKRQWMLVLSAGHLVNDETCFSHRPVQFDAVVTRTAEVVSFSEEDVRRLMRSCPDLTIEMMRSLTSKLDIKLQLVSALTFHNARDRISALRDYLSQAGLPLSVSDLTHQDVADIVGCCRVTASKVLAGLDN